MTIRTYSSPQAFKQALEQRLRTSARTGAELTRNRQLLVFDRFLARVVAVLGDAATLNPKRGHVRACKADAAAYTADDWRHALVASLGAEPVDRDDAIRAAAEWARDHLGLAFARLRGDGHIAEGLRSAINGAIRRGEVIRHNASQIARAPSSGREATGQLSLTLDAPAAGAGGRGERRA